MASQTSTNVSAVPESPAAAPEAAGLAAVCEELEIKQIKFQEWLLSRSSKFGVVARLPPNKTKYESKDESLKATLAALELPMFTGINEIKSKVPMTIGSRTSGAVGVTVMKVREAEVKEHLNKVFYIFTIGADGVETV